MRLRPLFAWLWTLFLFGGLALTARAQDAANSASPLPHGTIKVARISGEVFVIDHATGLKTRLSLSSLVNDHQTVATSANASVVLVFSNGATVNIKADSELAVNSFLQNPFSENFQIRAAIHEPSVSTTQLELRKGEIVSQVKKLNRDAGSSFTVETPVGAAGIRGTAFSVLYQPEGATARFVLSMAEGLIRFVPTHGHAVEVPAGKEVSALANLDLKTGNVISIPEVSPPSDVSPERSAELQHEVADAIGAGLNLNFAPTGTSPRTTGVNNPNTTQTAPQEQTATPAATDESAANPLASPPAVPPAQRTTPGDGA